MNTKFTLSKLSNNSAIYNNLERVRGIEPRFHPWQGRVLPLNYIRTNYQIGNKPLDCQDT